MNTWRLAGVAGLAVLLTGCGKIDSRWSQPPAKQPPGKLPAEIEQLRLEVEKQPSSSETRVRLATEYLKHDLLRDAAEEFRRSIQIDPQNADAVMGLWQVAARLSDVTGRLTLAERAMRVSPQDPNAATALREAAKAFDEALITHPRDPWILLNAALCQAKMKNWSQAEAYVRRAVEIAPSALTPRLVLASLYLDQGLTDQAAAEFARLVSAQPNNAVVREALGRARIAQGRPQDALAEFAAAQRLRPDWPVPYLNAGDACLRLRDYDGAVQSFAKTLQLAPHSLAGGLGMVQALTSQGKDDRAIEVSEAMLEDYPNHAMVLNNLAFLYAQKGRNLERALEIAGQLARAYPDSAVMRDTLGWVLYRAGRAKEAVAHLEEAARLAPGAGIVHYHLGKALLAAGRRGAATAAFRAALARGLPPEEKRDAESSI